MSATPESPIAFTFPEMNAKQRQVMNILRNTGAGSYTLVGYGGALGGGKLLALDTPIPTESGWVEMGDIRQGDRIFDERGQITTVLAAHEVVEEPECYRLTFDDGSTIDAGAEHLWLTFDRRELDALTRRSPEYRERRRSLRPTRATGRRSEAFTAAVTERNHRLPPPVVAAPTGSIRSTREIFDTLLTATGHTNHAIQLACPLELPDEELMIDPYVFGLWLGDGTTTQGAITTADPEIITSLQSAGYEVHPWASKYSYGVAGLQPQLRALGVLGNKHIPPVYLRSSREQRLALLQGLMDTDGTVCDGGSVEFTTTRKQLADATYELITSLGWKVRVVTGRATLYGRDCGPKYDMKWTPSEYVFRLPRKLAKQKLSTRRVTKFRYILRCDPITPVPMRCITVDSPSSLYLAGRQMVPTHNTFLLAILGIYLSISFPGNRIVIGRAVFAKLKTTTMEEFYKWCPPSLIHKRNDTDNWCEIRQPNWPKGVVSKVFFRGFDNWGDFGSEQYGAVLLEEAHEISEMSARILFTRLRHPLPKEVANAMGRPFCIECLRYYNGLETCPVCKTTLKRGGQRYFFIAASNPYPSWFERWFFRKQMEDLLQHIEGASVHFVPAFISDNKANLPENYEAVNRAGLPKDLADRLVEGRFEELSGLVYQLREKHKWLGPLPDKTLYTRVIGGLDFGGERQDSHFSAGMVGLITNGGRILRVSEFKERGANVESKLMMWMLAQQARWAQPLGKKILWTGDKSQRWVLKYWGGMGFNIKPSKGEEIWVGVQRVQRWMDFNEQDGFPGSFYIPELTTWEEDMRQYQWPPSDDGVDTPANRKPVKRNDDLLDADRYMHEPLDQWGGDPQEMMKNMLSVIE